MQVAVIDYNAGNTRSVYFALERLGVKADFTRKLEVIAQADKVIFPGVGEASTTMSYLREHGLDKVIKELTQPVLGICLGMQLLCTRSEENDTECLGIIEAKVRRFMPNKGEKVPHMGWNQLKNVSSPLFDPSMEGAFVYFVHSYFVEPTNQTIATTCHSTDFSSAIQHKNFFATQFHPEKSGPVGAAILKNFLAI